MLLPIGTQRRRRGFPWVTVSLIAANVIVYVGLQGGPAGSNFALVYGRFEPWMPITYMFAHGGPVHLLGNMIFLWVFGPHAEDALGHGRFLLLYATAGLSAAALHVLASALLYADELSVGLLGASGAVMGVVALFVLRYHGVRVRFLLWFFLPYVFTVRALWVGLAYFAMDLGRAVLVSGGEGMGGVAHWAHVGGFLAGAVWAWALRMPEEGTHEIQHDECRRLISAGAWEQAARLLQERITARPDDPDLHAQAATCHEMLHGGRPRAARHWNENLRLLLLAGRRDEAIRRFRALTEDFAPEDFDPPVLMRLGAACMRRDDPELALAAWLAVADAHANSPQAPAAALRAGRLLLSRDRHARAEHLLERVGRRWPDSQQALTADGLLRGMRRDAGR